MHGVSIERGTASARRRGRAHWDSSMRCRPGARRRTLLDLVGVADGEKGVGEEAGFDDAAVLDAFVANPRVRLLLRETGNVCRVAKEEGRRRVDLGNAGELFACIVHSIKHNAQRHGKDRSSGQDRRLDRVARNAVDERHAFATAAAGKTECGGR